MNSIPHKKKHLTASMVKPSIIVFLILALLVSAANAQEQKVKNATEVTDHPTIKSDKKAVMKKIKSDDGTLIAFWKSGSGPPLLLVHGTTADHTRWPSVLPALEKKFTVYVMDRRGRGESGDTEPYVIEREFEDIAAAINAIGEPVNVLGHSYGALCALEAAMLTDKIASLILYEPYISFAGNELFTPGTIDKMQAMLRAGDREGVVTMLFREIVKVPEEELGMLRAHPSWQRRVAAAHTIPRESIAELNYRFVAERFSRLHVPVLLLQGGDSPIELKKPTDLVNGALPNSRIVVMPGQQHIAMNTAPELFVSEVVKFLKQ